ncbi:MAG: hypothetical protein HYU69_09210 [Bacteroidetes bacterium]|nr:hypothetical protein [Bacteroidota bacterium]
MNRILLKYDWLRRFIFSFSIQLLMVHIKKNLTLMIFWAIMFGFVTEHVAPRYGVPYLFLSPEYFDRINFLSYFIVGFACGGFIMAFNISSYIMNGYRFPFIATLYNPFFKYCTNNSVIPALFIATYIYNIFRFQLSEQVYSTFQIIILIAGLIAGIVTFIILSTSYFFTINKDIYKMFGVRGQDTAKETLRPNRQRIEWKNLNLIKESRDWYVETYWTMPFVNKLVRPVRHYKKEMLRNVFKQNHRNAFIFVLLAAITLFVLSFFQNVPFFIIPAGASIFLLFTMFLMLSSALYVWIRGWASLLLIAIFLIVNSLYKLDVFSNYNKAYGLNYGIEKAPFTNEALNKMSCDSVCDQIDIKYAVEILNRWRLKNISEKSAKPKLVLVNTTGGGLRASLWTFYSLQYADSISGGELLKHTQLITGSSGGMIGAAYLRELYWQQQSGKIDNMYLPEYKNNMGKDILNPIAFSLAVNDFFFPLQKVEKGYYKYNKDRAYAFEWRLNQNTNGILDKRLHDYKQAESEAIIPMMIFSPTVANDGRKMLISAQPISYLTQNSYTKNLDIQPIYDAMDFGRLFEKQGAQNVHFTSVLRMSATFPYISPIVSLPSEPRIEVLDAGMRDNFGLEISLKYMYALRNWITSNTSGVIIIQIRDKKKEWPIDENPTRNILQNVLLPLGLLYSNLFNIQDFNQDQLLQYASLWFDQKVDIINFEMKRNQKENISLSWHLTNKEKRQVLGSIDLPENQEAFKKLKELLK